MIIKPNSRPIVEIFIDTIEQIESVNGNVYSWLLLYDTPHGI